MPLKVSFTLSARDLAHLRGLLDGVHAEHDEETLRKAALRLVEQVRGARPPDFVAERVATIETLAEMLVDRDWVLPASVRRSVRTALAYFVDPDDLIPDTTPVLGYLDDAILIELATRQLGHEISAYRDFQRYRNGRRERSHEELVARRKRLRVRIQDRNGRETRRFRLL